MSPSRFLFHRPMLLWDWPSGVLLKLRRLMVPRAPRYFFVQSERICPGEYRQSGAQDILGCVRVPTMLGSALRTSPGAHVQRERFEDMTAGRTAFARRIKLVDLNKGPPVPVGFIFQLTGNLAPANIRYGLGETRVLDPVFDLQTLRSQHLVLAHQTGCEFVRPVLATVRDLDVNPGHF